MGWKYAMSTFGAAWEQCFDKFEMSGEKHFKFILALKTCLQVVDGC